LQLALSGTNVAVEVILDIDSNGMLQVTAIEFPYQVQNSAVLQTNRLSDQQLAHMIEDAHHLQVEDDTAKKIVAAQNELESNIFSLQQNINVIENPALQKQITDFVADLESWVLANPRNLSLYQQKLEEVNTFRTKYNL